MTNEIPFEQMSENDLEQYFVERNIKGVHKYFKIQFDAIELCFRNKFINPVLILIYSTIDTFSYLDRINDEEKVVDRFARWVDTFLLPNSDLKCSALELYAARCGMVHSSTAESDLSKKGKVRQIFYGPEDKLWEVMKKQKKENEYCTVRIPLLVISLIKAYENYFKYLHTNTHKFQLVIKRVDKLMAEDNKDETDFISKHL